MVIIVFGLPGSGKSYFAEELAGRLKAIYVSSDRVRKNLIRDIDYSPEERSAVYDKMLQLTKDAVLREDADVVLDGTFPLDRHRRLFDQALEQCTDVHFIEITAPKDLVAERLAKPRQDSDADLVVYDRLKKEWEPEEKQHLVLCSELDNLEAMLEVSMNHLHIVHDNPGRP